MEGGRWIHTHKVRRRVHHGVEVEVGGRVDVVDWVAVLAHLHKVLVHAEHIAE